MGTGNRHSSYAGEPAVTTTWPPKAGIINLLTGLTPAEISALPGLTATRIDRLPPPSRRSLLSSRMTVVSVMRNSEDWPKCHGGTDTTNLVPTGTLIVGRGRTWLSVSEGDSGVGALTAVVTGAYSIGDRSHRTEALAVYLATVLRSTPRLRATSAFLRPAFQASWPFHFKIVLTPVVTNHVAPDL